MLGRIYGQVPALVPTLVALLAVVMGLNLLGGAVAAERMDEAGNKVPSPGASGGGSGLRVGGLSLHHAGAGGAAGLDRPERRTAGGNGIAHQFRHRPGAAAAGRLPRIGPKLLSLRAVGRWVPPISGGAAHHRHAHPARPLELIRYLHACFSSPLRWLSDLRLAIVLLLLIALASAVGTAIPQGDPPARHRGLCRDPLVGMFNGEQVLAAAGSCVFSGWFLLLLAWGWP